VKVRLVLVLVMLGCLLTILLGCGSAISEGTVTDKTHRPSYIWIQNVCAGYNSQGVCTTQVPIVHTEPDRYTLSLQEGEDTGWVYVTEGEFDTYVVGDHYPKPR